MALVGLRKLKDGSLRGTKEEGETHAWAGCIPPGNESRHNLSRFEFFAVGLVLGVIVYQFVVPIVFVLVPHLYGLTQ